MFIDRHRYRYRYIHKDILYNWLVPVGCGGARVVLLFLFGLLERVSAREHIVDKVHLSSRGTDSTCECEHNNPDSLDARLFFTVVLADAPAVTTDEASSLSNF